DEPRRGAKAGERGEPAEPQPEEHDGGEEPGGKRRERRLQHRLIEPGFHQPRATRITPLRSRTRASARFSCATFATSNVKRMNARSSRVCVRTAVTLIFSRASASPMSRRRPRRSVAVTLMSTV